MLPCRRATSNGSSQSSERAANRGTGSERQFAGGRGVLQLEANACERMGQSDKSNQLVAQARDLFSSAGYRQGAGRTLLMDADILFDQGDFVGREEGRKWTRPFQFFRNWGGGARVSVRRTNGSGNILYQQGKTARGGKLL